MARTTLRAPARHPSARSDADLVALTRSGDESAYAELWRRHSRAGLAVARSFTSTFDADDLVSEAYAKILRAITEGGGPTAAFRAYLFTTIRNTASGWGRARHEVPIDHADELEDPSFSETNTLAALDRSLTAQAFRSLPTRWQEALWYCEVEQMTPLEVAPLLGMKANAVAALAYRAREGLRQAWIQAHLSSTPADSECRWSIERLGSYARRGLGRRDTARLEAHLEICAKCSIVASEAREVGSRLALVILPLSAGIAGAGAYTAWLQSGAHTTAAALATSAGAGGSTTGSSAAGGSASSASGGLVVAGSVTAGVLVVAAAATTIAFGPTIVSALFGTPAQSAAVAAPNSQPVAPPSAAPSPSAIPVQTSSPSPSAAPSPAPGPVSSPSPAASVETQPHEPSTPTPTPTPTPTAPPVDPPAVPLPVAPVVTAPAASAVLTNAGTLVVSGTGEPGAVVSIAPDASPSAPIGSTTVLADGTWTVTADLAALSDGVAVLDVAQTNSAGSSPAVTITVTVDRTAEAPVISSVDTGTAADLGLWFPIVSGTAEPGASIHVTAQTGTDVRITADANGAWSTPQLADLSVGDTTLSVVQTDPAGNVSPAATVTATVAAPPSATVTGTGSGFDLTISGVPGAGLEALADGYSGWGPTAVDSSGTSSQSYTWSTTAGDHTVTVRYGSGGRFGPAVTNHVTIG